MKKGRRNTRLVQLTIVFSLLLIYPDISISQKNKYSNWKHISIDPILPGSRWGTGGPAVAGFNKDGFPDVAISRRNNPGIFDPALVNLRRRQKKTKSNTINNQKKISDENEITSKQL